MTKTTNYQLNQWAKSDRVMMDDFNADNTKIDVALKANADAIAEHGVKLTQLGNTLMNLGNCAFYMTTYVGTDATPSYTFPHKPMVIMISEADTKRMMIFWRGMTRAYHITSTAYQFTLTWNGNTVSWDCPSDVKNGFCDSNCQYQILALLDMEN